MRETKSTRSVGSLRALVISSVMTALALVLPVAFHAVGLGNKFLPMLLPLLLNGFLVPLPWAVLTGAAVPLVSSLATGMPPMFPPIAAGMALEGAVLGGVAAVMFGAGRRSLWIAVAGAIVLGRLAGLAALYLLAKAFGLPPGLASLASLVQGIPGVILQVAVVPTVVGALARGRGRGLLFQHEPDRQA
jgi:hypothetical protein